VSILKALREREPRTVEAMVIGALMGVLGLALSLGVAWLSMSLALKCRGATAAPLVLAAEAASQPPYSCRLLYDEERKCARAALITP